jgi:hypothetical protein
MHGSIYVCLLSLCTVYAEACMHVSCKYLCMHACVHACIYAFVCPLMRYDREDEWGPHLAAGP